MCLCTCDSGTEHTILSLFDWTGVNRCLLLMFWSLQTSWWALPFSIVSSYTPSCWTFQVSSSKTNMFVLIWAKKKATESIKENRSWIENSEGDIQKKNRVFSSGIHWVSEPFLVAFQSWVLICEGLPFPAVENHALCSHEPNSSVQRHNQRLVWLCVWGSIFGESESFQGVLCQRTRSVD